MFKARPYQLEAEASTLAAWESGLKSVLGVLPTGCGKTAVIAMLIQRLAPKKAIFLAHRKKLIHQAREAISSITGFSVEIEMGDIKASMDKDLLRPDAQVVVSSIQTLTAGGDGLGRMSKFNPDDFGVLLVDECHHAAADSYGRVINYFRQNPNLLVLGVTATPDRADEATLREIFEYVPTPDGKTDRKGYAFDYEILDAINDGWLVPIYQYVASVEDLDFSEVRTTLGDLNNADLDRVMTAEKPLHQVASTTIEVIGDKRGIGFAASVNHARMLSNIFNRHRPGMSMWICGKTEELECDLIYSKFKNGDIQFIWNCGVLTEGFDDSGVEVVSMGRPTKSRSLYAQCCGRATRLHHSIAHKINEFGSAAMRRSFIARSCKPSCTSLDFVGNSGRHKLMTAADLLGGHVSEAAREEAAAFARKAGKAVRMDRTLEEQQKLLDEKRQRELEAESKKLNLKAKSKYTLSKVDPFDVFQIRPVVSTGRSDDKKQLSPAQANIMRKHLGLDPDQFTYAESKRLIDEQFNRWNKKLCTFKMAKQLKRFGLASDVSMEQGAFWLSAIEKNGWKRPLRMPEFTPSKPVADVQDNGPTYSQPESDDIPF